VAARSNLSVCGCLLAGIAGSNPAATRMFVSCAFLVSLGRDLCEGLITLPEESYPVWCVRMGVIVRPWYWRGPDQMGAVAPWAEKVSHTIDYQLSVIILIKSLASSGSLGWFHDMIVSYARTSTFCVERRKNSGRGYSFSVSSSYNHVTCGRNVFSWRLG